MGPQKVLRPRKRLGQHFLVDPSLGHRIVEAAGFDPGDPVLEIGPGKGALTFPLARKGVRLVAVEKDALLCKDLAERLARAGHDNVRLVNEDILTFDFRKVTRPGGGKVGVIGNLPYNISTPLLERLTECRDMIGRSVLMFQREVGERLTASPGGKAYGAMTVLVRYHAAVRPLIRVPPTAFRPRPKVESMLLELDFERPYPRRAEPYEAFRRTVKAAFSHRRKTLVNSMRDFDPARSREELESALQRCGIDLKARAETLAMDDFLCLAAALH